MAQGAGVEGPEFEMLDDIAKRSKPKNTSRWVVGIIQDVSFAGTLKPED